MNLGLDISQIVYKGTGVARFTEGLVNAIVTNDTENTWTFVFFGLRQKPHAEIVELINNSRHKLIQRPFPPTLLAFLHNTIHNYTTPITLGSIAHQLDWFITSDWTEPALPCKKATIVHDLVFKRYPETVHTRIRNTQEERLFWVARESNLIFTDSETTAADLKQHYRLPDEKVIVNYPGLQPEILESANSPTIEDVRTKFDIPEKFFLTVGKLEPRKNIPRLLEAFSKIDTDASLVVVGMEGWGEIPHTDDARVLFPGYVSDDELGLLYSTALGFVYPSLYEGFGYPVLEAMKYRCPVIVSDTSSLSEIASDAALLFDPLDVEAMKLAMEQLIQDENLRKELIQKGEDRASTFTWNRYYTTLISSLSANNV